MEHKTVQFKLKDFDDKTGQFTAIFSRFNVIDSDGDVTKPGAFQKDAPVRIGAWGHTSWHDKPVIGRGTIDSDDEKALVAGQFYMDMESARETYFSVKGSRELQQWSYGFDILPGGSESGEFEEQEVRFLQPREDGSYGVEVHEVAPVLLGAGIETETVDIKGAKSTVSYEASSPAPDERSWDATAAVNRLRKWASSDGSGDKETITWSKYRRGFTWYDREDAESFGAYKLPHHDIIDGTFSVIWRGVAAAMGALLGARGGVDIPDSDRRSVYNHLKKHYAQFEKDPPDFRSVGERSNLSYTDEGDILLAEVSAFVDRTKSLADLRAEDNRTLSEAHLNRLTQFQTQLSALEQQITEMLVMKDEGKEYDPKQLYLQYQQIQAQLHGVQI